MSRPATTEEEAREAVEVAAQLYELTQHQGWQYLLDFVKSFAISRQNRMIQGHIETLDKYREEAGWLMGAQFVLDAPKTAAGIAEGAARLLPPKEDE